VVLRELTFLSDGKCTLYWDGAGGQTHAAEIRVVGSTDSGIYAECPEHLDPGSALSLEVKDCRPISNAILSRTDANRSGDRGEEPAPGASPATETDFYETLQISPNADPETIHRVHRIMAARFHPDNPETGDLEKFLVMRAAYQVLSDPVRRREYDMARQLEAARPDPIFALKDFVIGIDAEKNRRLGVLSLLYNQRRGDTEHPGVQMLELEKRMAIPREHLEFTIWYLRSKKFIAVDDTSAYTLTALGADYVEENAPTNPLLEQLLRQRSRWANSSPAPSFEDRGALRQNGCGIKGVSNGKSISAPEARDTL
jgi:curved DNA-binding protein CbpA